MKLGRLLRTLAHLKPSQILWRVRYRVEKAAGWTRLPVRPNGAPQWDTDALARLRGARSAPPFRNQLDDDVGDRADQRQKEDAIVHADDRLVVADKPAGLPVMPTGPWVRETLQYRVLEQLGLSEAVPLHLARQPPKKVNR